MEIYASSNDWSFSVKFELIEVSLKSSDHRRKHIFISIVFRVLVNFMITFAIIAVLQSLWYFTITLSFAVKQIQATRVDLINVIKNGLNVNDIASLAQEGKINSTGFTDDPKYLVIMDWLDSIHKVSPTTWPYVFVPDKQGQDIINLVDVHFFAK